MPDRGVCLRAHTVNARWSFAQMWNFPFSKFLQKSQLWDNMENGHFTCMCCTHWELLNIKSEENKLALVFRWWNKSTLSTRSHSSHWHSQAKSVCLPFVCRNCSQMHTTIILHFAMYTNHFFYEVRNMEIITGRTRSCHKMVNMGKLFTIDMDVESARRTWKINLKGNCGMGWM